MRSTTLALIVTCVAGCATLTQDSLDQRYGRADTTRFDRAPIAAAGGVSYRDDVRPILDNRCVVCHGCYDAACQLKLGSWEGIVRGATKAPVYDSARLSEARPTRLFVDAQLPSQWRGKGFDPVLNERTPSPENNLTASVLYRSLALKRAHPLPDVKVLPDSFDFSLERSQSCPNLGEFEHGQRTRVVREVATPPGQRVNAGRDSDFVDKTLGSKYVGQRAERSQGRTARQRPGDLMAQHLPGGQFVTRDRVALGAAARRQRHVGRRVPGWLVGATL